MADQDETPIVESTTSMGRLAELFKANKVLIAMIIVLVLVVIVCIISKKGDESMKGLEVRSDQQSGWAVDKEVNKFLEYQEKLIQKIKLANESIEDAFL